MQMYEIKRSPEDFIVEEITRHDGTLSLEKPYPFEPSEGENLICVMQKRNWDTLMAINAVARGLGISPNRIGFAGTKDKKAVTSQLISVWGVKKDGLARIKARDIKVFPLRYANGRLNIGDLIGNHFRIRVYSDSAPKGAGRFPNRFGEQRFGAIRPITAEVGEMIVREDFEKAVRTYLGAIDGREEKASLDARRRLNENWDYAGACAYYPKHLRYERQMLESLAKHPKDYLMALRAVPRSLLKMFVHAYQSRLFNEFLDAVLERGMNYDTGPLYGYDSQLENELEQEILEKNGLELEMFRMRNLHDLRSRGARRALWARPDGMKMEKDGDSWLLDFSLPKGCYATVVIDGMFSR